MHRCCGGNNLEGETGRLSRSRRKGVWCCYGAPLRAEISERTIIANGEARLGQIRIWILRERFQDSQGRLLASKFAGRMERYVHQRPR